jgi:hypothetical protein
VPDRYPGVCRNPSCTREDGVCIGYHCPHCGKPSTVMGHPDCLPMSPASRAEKQLQDAVTALRGRINAALALHARNDDGTCRVCWDTDGIAPQAWPCDSVAALKGDRPMRESDRG